MDDCYKKRIMTACKQPLLPDNLRTKTVQRISYWGIISLAVPGLPPIFLTTYAHAYRHPYTHTAALMCSATQIATTIDTAFYGQALSGVRSSVRSSGLNQTAVLKSV